MNTDDVVRDPLIARITQLTARIDELEKQAKTADGVIWDLSTCVNNLMGLASESQRATYRRQLELAREVRHDR